MSAKLNFVVKDHLANSLRILKHVSRISELHLAYKFLPLSLTHRALLVKLL